MALLGLGYAGFGSDNLEDWRQFGTGLVGWLGGGVGGGAAGGGARQFAAGVPDGRPQAAHRDRPRDGRRDALLRLGGCRQRGAGCAGGAAGKGRRACHRRTADAGRRQARPQPDFVSRSRRQPAGGVLRRRDRRHAVHAGTFDLGFSHRPARPRARRADGREHRPRDGVLCRRARLRAFRLHRKTVPRLFLPCQRAASQPRADRDRQERHASSDGGAVLARRCRPVLRHRT